MKTHALLGPILLLNLALFGPPAVGAEQPAGVLVEGLVTLAKPDQTYTLYLPSGYTPDQQWPVLFVMDREGVAGWRRSSSSKGRSDSVTSW